MSFILTAKGQHEKAIAFKWTKMFEIILHGIKDDKRDKIWKTVASCKNEEQLCNYFHVVKNYSDAHSYFDAYNLRACLIWHVYRLMRFI